MDDCRPARRRPVAFASVLSFVERRNDDDCIGWVGPLARCWPAEEGERLEDLRAERQVVCPRQATALEERVVRVGLGELNQLRVREVEVVDREGDEREVVCWSAEEVAQGVGQERLALAMREMESQPASGEGEMEGRKGRRRSPSLAGPGHRQRAEG